MYAIVNIGGKQHRVRTGDVIQVELMNVEVGAMVKIDRVLAFSQDDGVFVAGSPQVAGAFVQASVEKRGRHDKVKIFKMRRRKHYQKRQGHRQWFTELRIQEIQAPVHSY